MSKIINSIYVKEQDLFHILSLFSDSTKKVRIVIEMNQTSKRRMISFTMGNYFHCIKSEIIELDICSHYKEGRCSCLSVASQLCLVDYQKGCKYYVH